MTTASGAEIQQAEEVIAAEERLGLAGGREQQVRRRVVDEAMRRPAALREGGAADARSRLTSAPAARASSIARRPASPSGEPISEYAGRWTRSTANQPGFRSSGRSSSAAPRSATNERSPPNITTTPIRPVGLPATRIGRTGRPVGADRLDERPAGRVAPNRGHERRARAQPGQPARGVRRRTALAQGDRARDVGAALERPGRDHDHVEHQVADDGDARRNRLGGGGRRGRRGRRGRWGVGHD